MKDLGMVKNTKRTLNDHIKETEHKSSKMLLEINGIGSRSQMGRTNLE